jgi:hypothetical protein
MAIVNFPNNPSLNDIYTNQGRSWKWNGQYWQATNVTAGYTGSKGDTGPAGGYTGSAGAGYTGSQGTPGPAGGYTGSVGYVGSLGYVGSQGPAGGYTGSVGYVGSQGPPGGYTGSGGQIGYTFSASPPSNPAIGDRWLDSYTMAELIWMSDGDSTQWVEVAGTGFLGKTGYTGSRGQFGFTFSNTAPISPNVGDRWLDSQSMSELIWVSDGDSAQWVEVAGTGFLSTAGSAVTSSGFASSSKSFALSILFGGS